VLRGEITGPAIR